MKIPVFVAKILEDRAAKEFRAVNLLPRIAVSFLLPTIRKGKTMRKIVKEPFAPKRRHINKVESRVGWWRALFAVVSLIFLVLVG